MTKNREISNRDSSGFALRMTTTSKSVILSKAKNLFKWRKGGEDSKIKGIKIAWFCGFNMGFIFWEDKMKKILIALLVMFVSAVFFNQTVNAEQEHGKKHKGEKGKHACYEKAGIHRGGYIHAYIGMYKEHGKELSLSQEQVDKMAAIDKECDDACNKLGEEIEAAESALDALVKSDVIDMKVVGEKIKEVHDLRGKLELAHFELLSKAQAILTPEQREKCRKFCEKKTGNEWPMIH